MKVRTAIASLLLLTAAGCKSNNSTTSGMTSTPASATRSYNGTASVGDFLTIELDSTAHTLTYSNHSNGDAGTVPYTINSDGTYTLNDPNGNLIAAYEVPNYALLIQAAKTGPDHNTKALITAVLSSPISLSTMESHNYSSMQFRTNSGGFEAGSVKIDAQGNIAVSSYWPFGAEGQGSGATPFNTGGFPGSSFQEDSSGEFLTHDDGQGSYDFVFGTQNGIFAVDTPNAANRLATSDQQGLRSDVCRHVQSDLLPEDEGSDRRGQQRNWHAKPRQRHADCRHKRRRHTDRRVKQHPRSVRRQRPLTDPCYGLFTFRSTTSTTKQDMFVTFQGRAVLFSSFTGKLPQNPSNSYDYFYAVAMK